MTKSMVVAAAALAFLAMGWPSAAQVVLRLPTDARVVALTFDACEQQRAMKLDTGISDYLVAHGIPFTLFLSGRFVEDNAAAIRELATLDFVEMENHSYDHPNRMPRLDDDQVRAEIVKADDAISRATGRHTQFFRFPAITYDARTLGIAESLGYRVVHYRWEVGDPDPRESADRIVRETMEGVRPGDILIFHINGRGWHTAEALPHLVDGLRDKGYRFVLLRDYIKPAR
ncbi:MAG: polysaccharide deacetylase family protein [Alphaproteobacteria bacterium]|nr:polysaccharide deacetylase family protein [Alphaproteobacteria bacterium]